MLLRIFPRRRRSSALKPLDAVFTEFPMNNLLQYPLCRVCSVATTLACLCVMLGFGRFAAVPVTLSIPGTVTVTIEPARGDGGPAGEGRDCQSGMGLKCYWSRGTGQRGMNHTYAPACLTARVIDKSED